MAAYSPLTSLPPCITILLLQHLFQLPGVEDSVSGVSRSSRMEMAASGQTLASRSRHTSRSGPVMVMCPILRDLRMLCLPYQCTLASGICRHACVSMGRKLWSQHVW